MTDQPIDVRVSQGLDAIYGQTSGTAQDGSTGLGVHGQAMDGGTGVRGSSAGGDGVLGTSGSVQHAGLSGVNDSGGFGVWARGTPAGHFESPSADGIQGSTNSSNQSGVFGSNSATAAVPAGSPGGSGVFGVSTVPSASGVFGAHNNAGKGVSGFSENGIGLWGAGRVAGHFEGDVEITGTLKVSVDVLLANADCAEEFELVEDAAPGSVMVLDGDGRLRRSRWPYDTRVAGVVCGAGDVRPALVLGHRPSPGPRARVALMGRVYCLADATQDPIRAGNLLTTGAYPGHAIRARGRRLVGAVLGKALGPLGDGRGLIPILVALQ